MKLKDIRYKDIYGISELTIPVNSVVWIEGQNGAGKSSIIRPIVDLVEGGHDPDIIRAGCDSGEMVMTFQNGWTLRIAVTKKDTYRQVRDEAGKKVPRLEEKAYIESVLAALSVDPLRFMDPRRGSEKKDEEARIEILLKMAHIQVTSADLTSASGEPAEAADAAGDGLDAIERFHAKLELARRNIGREAETKKTHGEQLLATAPPDLIAPADIDVKRSSLAEKRESVDRFVAGARALTAGKLDGLRAAAAEKIAAINRQLNADIEAAKDEAQRDVDNFASEVQPQIDQLTAEIATMEAQAAAYRAAESARTLAKSCLSEAAKLSERYDALTKALRGLEQLKLNTMKELPLDNVRIEGRKILVTQDDGTTIPFSLLNHAQRALCSLRLSVKSCGEVPLVCLDGMEAFDAAHREAILETAKRYAAEQGMQFIFTRVAEGGLSVREF